MHIACFATFQPTYNIARRHIHSLSSMYYKTFIQEASTPQTDYRLSNYHVNKNIFKCKEEFSLISKVIVRVYHSSLNVVLGTNTGLSLSTNALFTPPLSTSFFSASCRFIGWGSLENPRPCCQRQRILTLLPQWRYGYSGLAHPVECASQVWQRK